MDTYIGLPVVTARALEVKRRINHELDEDKFNFGDPDCIEGAALLKDHIATKNKLDVYSIVRDLAEILWQMHSKGLTHGSVDVCNITVDFQSRRAKLLPGYTMQFRHWAAAGDMPLGTGKHTTTTGAMHFTGSQRWDSALEDLWALTVVTLQLLDNNGPLNEPLSPLPRLVWLTRFFAQPEEVKAKFLQPLLESAHLPAKFKSLLSGWWTRPSQVANGSPCDFYTSLGLEPLQSCQGPAALMHRPHQAEQHSKVLHFAVNNLKLACIDAEFVHATLGMFNKNFRNNHVTDVASVLLAIKLNLQLHFKRAEVACAALAKEHLTLEQVQAVYTLETWFLTNAAEAHGRGRHHSAEHIDR